MRRRTARPAKGPGEIARRQAAFPCEISKAQFAVEIVGKQLFGAALPPWSEAAALRRRRRHLWAARANVTWSR